MKFSPKMIEENRNRLKALFSEYDPVSGIGSPIPRKLLSFSGYGRTYNMHLPVEMFSLPAISLLNGNSLEKLGITECKVDKFLVGLNKTRMDYDFEFWAITTVKIQDKDTKKDIPFRLNKPQRKLLKELEDMRMADLPIRIILLKARQWGGSTEIQIYYAWIQLRLKKNWHSAIIAEVENQSRNIRGMYTRMARNYPRSCGSVTFKPYEGSSKNRIIPERGCIMGVGSVKNPDSFRSFDFAMAHLSEVGLWKSTKMQSAEDLAQALRATVPSIAYSAIVLESTAKGVGNFFHREWLNAVNGLSGYRWVFIGWWEIERYQKPVDDIEKFVNTWGEYEWYLWNLGATIEGINWYVTFKRDEGYDDWRMKSEFPSTAEEAFQSTGRRAFAPLYVLQARKTCRKPEFIGDIFGGSLKGKEALQNLEVQPVSKGKLWVWQMPDTRALISNRYAAFADIGGRSQGADFSVVKVFDRYWMMEAGVAEVVAVWHGHLDQDLFAWKAAQIARFWNNALLAIETNSLKKTESEGDHFLTVLDEIAPFYPNLYMRTDPEKVRQGLPARYGFHTGLKSKVMLVDTLNGALRDQEYIERDSRACDEMDTFEIKPNGSYGAVDGAKDDNVIVTAGGVWLCNSFMPLPKVIQISTNRQVKEIVSEATL
jgi:hypothetical protein